MITHIINIAPAQVTVNNQLIAEAKKSFLPGCEKLADAFAFINMPVVLDSFTEHAERREYLKTIQGNDEWHLMQNNALRYNNLCTLLRVMSSAQMFMKPCNKNLCAEAEELLSVLANQYQGYNIDNKIAFVQEVRTLATAMLQFVVVQRLMAA